MKKLIVAVLTLTVSGMAMAAGENNVGSCGWGSKLFEGKDGVVSQSLAGITNGTFWNQTFGISSGTSGCTQDGVVKSNWRTALFIDNNKEKLARDMSVGQGETLDSLASLIGVRSEDKPVFFRAAKDNFDRIFTTANVSSDKILASLKEVMQANTQLVAYAGTI